MPRIRFTVRRMMVVVAILALPIWYLSLLIEISRQETLRSLCGSHISQLGKGLLAFAMANGHFPSGTVPRAGEPPEKRVGWPIYEIPFIGSYPDMNNIYTKGDPAAVPVAEFRIFQCPNNPSHVTTSGHGLIHYVGIAGLGTDAPTLPVNHPRAGMFGYDRTTRLVDIRDGASTTMMLAETSQANGPWFRGGPSTVRGLDPARQPYIGPKRQFGGTHRGGANVAFADGSVKFVRETVDPRVFEAVSAIAGGETVPANWDR